MLADAAAPFIYLMAGKLLQEKLAPMDWSLFVKSETSKAKCKTSVLSRSVALSVPLTTKASLLQTGLPGRGW